MWYKKNAYLCIVLINNDCFTEFKKQRKMKKLVFMFVAMAAISFASCDQKKAGEAVDAAVDSAAAVVDSVAAAADSTVQAAAATADSTVQAVADSVAKK